MPPDLVPCVERSCRRVRPAVELQQEAAAAAGQRQNTQAHERNSNMMWQARKLCGQCLPHGSPCCERIASVLAKIGTAACAEKTSNSHTMNLLIAAKPCRPSNPLSAL